VSRKWRGQFLDLHKKTASGSRLKAKEHFVLYVDAHKSRAKNAKYSNVKQ